MKVSVRQSTEKDLDLITEYTLAIHYHEDDGMLTEHADFRINLRKWLAQEMDNPQTIFLIAELDRQPVGFISASTIIIDNGFLQDPAKGIIQLTWVEEKSRKTHIARTLVENIETCFMEIGIKYIECSYTSHNNLAAKFWEKIGYAPHSISARKFIGN